MTTSLFLLCKVQAIVCKFIMATMYKYKCKCKGKGMTTSKCKSKKALLRVSSKLSSWSRKKVKKEELCVRLPSLRASRPNGRLLQNPGKAVGGSFYKSVRGLLFIYSLYCIGCVRWIVITRSRQSVILLPWLALNWKRHILSSHYHIHSTDVYIIR